MGFPRGSMVKNPPASVGDAASKVASLNGEGPLEKEMAKWQLTPVFLPEKSHGQRSLAGYSPDGHKELART